MKTRNQTNQGNAFTLVELLVVIAIVGILAAIIVPVVGRSMVKAKVATAKKEMADIAAAIKSYQTTYSRWPVQPNYIKNTFGDVTFGWRDNGGAYHDNSTLMELLCNRDYGRGTDVARRNPKKIRFLDLSENSDGDGFPGLSPFKPAANGINYRGPYHDPFGSEYRVSVDFNGDNLCADVFYGRPQSSAGGSTGLKNRKQLKNGIGPEVYVLEGTVMVWSLGPDKLLNENAKDNESTNADNILSWK